MREPSPRSWKDICRCFAATYWPLSILLVIAFLLYPVSGVTTLPDSSRYLIQAKNLFRGVGFTDVYGAPFVARGPVFPLALALGFYVGGLSLQSAVGVVKLFSLGNLILVYLIGERLYGKSVGFAAAAFTLASLTIYSWSSLILLDSVMPFFMLASQYLWLIGSAKKSKTLVLVAGTALGVGYLVKPVALLVLFFPLALWLLSRPLRSRTYLRHILVYWFGTVLIILPWDLYVFAVANSQENSAISQAQRFSSNWIERSVPDLAVGSTAAIAPTILGHGTPMWGALASYVSSIPASADLFYRRYFFGELGYVAIILFVCWLYLVAQKIRGKGSLAEDVLLSSLLPFLPILAFLALTGWRVGQLVYFYLLSWLAIAYVMRVTIQTSIAAKHDRWVYSGAVVAVTAMLIYAPPKPLALLWNSEGSIWPGVFRPRIFATEEWTQAGLHDEHARAVAEWLDAHLGEHAVIMSEHSYAQPLAFLSNRNGFLAEMPRRSSVSAEDAQGDRSTNTATPLFILPSDGTNNYLDTDLTAFAERDLQERISSENVRYVVTTRRYGFLSLYFFAHPCFVKVMDVNDGEYQVFKVEPDCDLKQYANRFPLSVAQSTAAWLNQLRSADRGLYDLVVDNFLGGELGLSSHDIRQIAAGKYPPIRLSQPYAEAEFVTVQGGDANNLDRLIDQYQEIAEREPASPWPTIMLIELMNSRTRLQEGAATCSPEITGLFGRAIRTGADQLSALRKLLGLISANKTCISTVLHEQLLVELNNMCTAPDAKQPACLTYLNAGILFENHAHEAEAITRLETAFPNNVPVLRTIAGLYGNAGRLREAEAYLRAAVGIEPEDPESQQMLAAVLKSTGQYSQLAAYYRDLLTGSASGNGPYHIELGKLYLDWTECIRDRRPTCTNPTAPTRSLP